MKTSVLVTGLTLAASISASAVAGQPNLKSDASTRQLVERFVDAYANRDAGGLHRSVTKDFTARLVAAPLSNQITVSTEALARSWQGQTRLLPTAYGHSAVVDIYPTPQAHTLFVTYRVPGQTGQGKRVALIELRGHRVTQISDFPGSGDEAISESEELAKALN